MRQFILLSFFFFSISCDSTPKIQENYGVDELSQAPELVNGGRNGQYNLALMKAEDTPSTQSEPSLEVANLNASYRKSLHKAAIQNGYKIGFDRAVVVNESNDYWVATHLINVMYETTGRCPTMIGHRLIYNPTMLVLFLALQGTEYSESISVDRLIEAGAHLKDAESKAPSNMKQFIKDALQFLIQRITEMSGVKFLNSNNLDDELSKVEKLNLPEEQKVKMRAVLATVFRFKQSGELYSSNEKLPQDRTLFQKYEAGKGSIVIYGGVGFTLFYWKEQNVDASPSIGFIWNGSVLVPLVDIRITKEGEHWYVYCSTVQAGAGYKGMIGDNVEFRIGPFINFAAIGLEESFSWGDPDAEISKEEFEKKVKQEVEKLSLYLIHDNKYFAQLTQKYLGLALEIHPQVQKEVILNLFHKAARYVKNMNNRRASGAQQKND